MDSHWLMVAQERRERMDWTFGKRRVCSVEAEGEVEEIKLEKRKGKEGWAMEETWRKEGVHWRMEGKLSNSTFY